MIEEVDNHKLDLQIKGEKKNKDQIQPDILVKENQIMDKNIFEKLIFNNFNKEFSNNYNNKTKEELKENFFNILTQGIKAKATGFNFNLSYIDFNLTEGYEKMLQELKEDTNLNSLLLANNPNFTSSQFSNILSDFGKVKSLKKVFLYKTDLNSEELANGLNSLFKISKLTDFLISNDNLCDSGLKNIIPNLGDSFINITFTSTGFTKASFNLLGELIKNCKTLKSLFISNCNLEIGENYDLKDLNNSENFVFLDALSKNESLENLSIVGCNLAKEAEAIFKVLESKKDSKRNSKIKFINLSENKIGPENFKNILESIKTIKLKYLILNGNKVGDLGMYHLYDYLEDTYPMNKNKIKFDERVSFIELEDNEIRDKGAKTLINAIDSDFFYLVNLNIKFNYIDSKYVKKIAEALVNFSERNEKSMDITKSGLTDIFKYLNISQIGIDVSKNNGMLDSEYKEIFTNLIEKEFDRVLK